MLLSATIYSRIRLESRVLSLNCILLAVITKFMQKLLRFFKQKIDLFEKLKIK